MTIDIEWEAECPGKEAAEEIIRQAVLAVLDYENCPYEAEVSVLLTDDDSIRTINRENRGVDAATDVLSFPMNEYPAPGDFSLLEEDEDAFDPESGELLLGDIVISLGHVREQAALYGHSEKRELAFLVVHSMLHLCGYDHIRDEDRRVMEERQRGVMQVLGISRAGESE